MGKSKSAPLEAKGAAPRPRWTRIDGEEWEEKANPKHGKVKIRTLRSEGCGTPPAMDFWDGHGRVRRKRPTPSMGKSKSVPLDPKGAAPRHSLAVFVR